MSCRLPVIVDLVSGLAIPPTFGITALGARDNWNSRCARPQPCVLPIHP